MIIRLHIYIGDFDELKYGGEGEAVSFVIYRTSTSANNISNS